MSESDLALDVLTDFFNAVEAGIAQARQRLKESKVKGSTKLPFDVSRIQWIDRLNEKGKFQVSEDYSNPDHKALLAYLNEHVPSKRVMSEGWFYWIWQDGAKIGRKLKK
jgi:hypothetical protein